MQLRANLLGQGGQSQLRLVGLVYESVQGVLLGPAPHAEAAGPFCEHWLPREVEDLLRWLARQDAAHKPAHLRAHGQVMLSFEDVSRQIQNPCSLLSSDRRLLNGAERMSKKVVGRHGAKFRALRALAAKLPCTSCTR